MGIDVEKLFAEAQAEDAQASQLSEGDQKPEDSGPDIETSESELEESGELEAEDSDETGWDEESDEEFEDEEESEEADGLAEEGSEYEDDSEDVEEAEEADPVNPEVERLQWQLKQAQDQLVQAQQQFAEFQQFMLSQQQAGGPGAVPGAQSQPELREALQLLFNPGNDPKAAEERFKRLPVSVQREAIERRNRAADDLAMDALDPAARFRYFAPHVQEMIHQAIAPFIQERQHSKVTQLAADYGKKLKTPQDKQRFVDILERVPGGDEALEARLEIAYGLFEKEKGSSQLARESQKLANQKRQLKANKQRSRRGKSKGRKGKKKVVLDGSESVEEMFYKIKESGDY